MDFISLGLGAASVGSSLLGSFGGGGGSKVDPNLSMFSLMNSLQENTLRRRQMNLDAMRRKRDIIRQAQIATARSESAAANQGALFSSPVEGARASVSGEAGVQTLGISQNQEIGNSLFDLANQKAMIDFQMSKQSNKVSSSEKFNAIGNTLSKNQDTLSKVANFGFSKFSSYI